MHETELKFQVPAARRSEVERALARAAHQTLHLRAQYFDTPDRRLAAAGLALRLRQEGRRWVQALKGPGDGSLQRLEHEVAVAGQRGGPLIEPARHAGTAAGDLLARALGPDAPALQRVFETDVRRSFRIVRHGSARIEVALDVGALIAGDQRQPLCELEFELKAGAVHGLLDLASRWAQRHALWLDVRTKAERGALLAQDQTCAAAVTAGELTLTQDMPAEAALRAIVHACLAQALPNAAALAAEVGAAAHLHQLRIALRRLDSALREFGAWSAAVDPAWQPALGALRARLGASRDRDALATSLLPQLRAAGAPLAELPPLEASDAIVEAMRAPGCARLQLELLAFVHGAQPPPAATALEAAAAPLRERFAVRLDRLHRRLAKDAAAFATLDDAQRHRARKRVKRLRYGVEFAASLYRDKDVRRYLARLRPAQEALGRYNDLSLAETQFRAHVPDDARAWFALGWLAARRAPLLRDAAKALEALREARVFWTRPDKPRHDRERQVNLER
jgi:triphosphatase